MVLIRLTCPSWAMIPESKDLLYVYMLPVYLVHLIDTMKEEAHLKAWALVLT